MHRKNLAITICTIFLFSAGFAEEAVSAADVVISTEATSPQATAVTADTEGSTPAEPPHFLTNLLPPETLPPSSFTATTATKDADDFEPTDGTAENASEEPTGTPEAPVESAEEQVPHVLIPFVTEEDLARPEVEKFRQQYLSPKWSKLLYTYLEQAMEYRLYVRHAIAQGEYPPYLEYLPIVESNYKTNAKSKSGAIGMWQFMANSVWPFLTLNDFVDERLDPWKSTDAALKKLADNYKTFGDWYIAIAAYNCGAGAMTKILKKGGKDQEGKYKDFWELLDAGLLPSQTAGYVPKLLAIADLAANTQYYGIDIPSHDEEYELLENEKNGLFDYVTVKKAYSITQLAQEMRMDTKELKKLNPSYTRGMTQPAKESKIRLPLGMEQSALDALAKLTPIDFPFKYKVEAGDSLWSISRRYGITVQAICDINDIRENDILKIGKILYIPAK